MADRENVGQYVQNSDKQMMCIFLQICSGILSTVIGNMLLKVCQIMHIP
ncbi:Uncharacterised protein [Sphingobacterium thalpophilum]|uniref:Uncharacterized protein n=1 Tax=Sphingobacterium thalpophilum TaxID=259 RepID=A0A4U9VTG8_9SPHI|nr:Uncharacterised protein [Sphingobacterium thalpophilum]